MDDELAERIKSLGPSEVRHLAAVLEVSEAMVWRWAYRIASPHPNVVHAIKACIDLMHQKPEQS